MIKKEFLEQSILATTLVENYLLMNSPLKPFFQAQLNRNVEARSIKKPLMSDLPDSGRRFWGILDCLM